MPIRKIEVGTVAACRFKGGCIEYLGIEQPCCSIAAVPAGIHPNRSSDGSWNTDAPLEAAPFATQGFPRQPWQRHGSARRHYPVIIDIDREKRSREANHKNREIQSRLR